MKTYIMMIHKNILTQDMLDETIKHLPNNIAKLADCDITDKGLIAVRIYGTKPKSFPDNQMVLETEWEETNYEWQGSNE